MNSYVRNVKYSFYAIKPASRLPEWRVIPASTASMIHLSFKVSRTMMINNSKRMCTRFKIKVYACMHYCTFKKWNVKKDKEKRRVPSITRFKKRLFPLFFTVCFLHKKNSHSVKRSCALFFPSHSLTYIQSLTLVALESAKLYFFWS